MSRTTTWIVVGAATLAVALDRLNLPPSTLFSMMMMGLMIALIAPGRLSLRGHPITAAHATTGVVLGAYLQTSSLKALAGAWLPVLVVITGTLMLSLVAGWLMARYTELSPPTAALGMIAGGSAGVIAMASELDADDRIVAFMQYVRVLMIVITAPLLVALMFGDPHAVIGHLQQRGTFIGTTSDWCVLTALVAVGTITGRLLRLPAPTLLGPLLLSAILTVTLPEGTIMVPLLAREVAFALIGLQIGLRFTAELFHSLARLLLPLLLSVFALSALCFGFAALLAATTSASLQDAYLATTPGGIYAVLAAAVSTGADTTYVVGVQSLRLIVMMLIAPFAVRTWLKVSMRRRSAAGAGVPGGSAAG
jgi:membrane AbrB-like protein